MPLLEQIAHKLGLPQLEEQRWGRHPLVYLMEAADDICYGLIDLEDGLEMELLDYSEVEALLLDLVGDDLPQTYRQLGPQDSRRRKLAILRGKAIEHLTNAAAQAFVAQQPALLAGTLPGDLVEHMHGPAKRRGEPVMVRPAMGQHQGGLRAGLGLPGGGKRAVKRPLHPPLTIPLGFAMAQDQQFGIVRHRVCPYSVGSEALTLSAARGQLAAVATNGRPGPARYKYAWLLCIAQGISG